MRMDEVTGAVFLDRDGVVCENRSDYVKTWAEFAFIPGAVEAIASLVRSGARVFIVTNQAAVGRGIMSRRTLDQMHEKMLDILAGSGATIEAVLVCPHHPDDLCGCRKPEPGMLNEAAERFHVDLSSSFMVGDAGTDIIAGARAGCATVLVRTGRGSESIKQRAWGKHKPDFIADDLVDAAIWILAQMAVQVSSKSGVRR